MTKTKINIIIKGNQKNQLVADLPKIASQFLREKKIRGNFLIYLSLVSKAKIKNLNARYRNINKSTNILSFPLLKHSQFQKKSAEKVLLGDIFISLKHVKTQIGKIHPTKNLKEETEFLFLHGLKHLLGYHHR